MIYTILSCVKQVGSTEPFYVVHGYDNTDLTNLVPTSTTDLFNVDDLIIKYKEDKLQCSNFSVDANMNLIVPGKLPEKMSAESPLVAPRMRLDDVWNFLHKLRQTDSLVIVTKEQYATGGFTDEAKTYILNARTLKYSTKHANCSMSYLVDGTIYNNDTDTVMSSKRWTTYKIIKDNKLLKRFLTFITTEDGLETLQKDSNVDIKAFPVGNLLNLPSMDMTQASSDMLYCIVDLHSLPLVDSNVVLTSNFHYIYTVTQNLNYISMLGKVCKSFMQELANRDIGVRSLLDSDEAYREKALVEDEEEKSNGVKFSLSGQSNVPSVNACLKALKSDKVKTVADVFDLSEEDAETISASFYRLNILQRTAMQTLFHLCKEYRNTKNPIICYQSTDNLCKFYLDQRELFKARLTYIRSMFMQNLHPSVFAQKKLFTNELNGTTVFIEFGEF